MKFRQTTKIAALVVAAGLSGAVAGNVFAAGAAGEIGAGLQAGQGETPDQLAKAKALNITAYEPEGKEGGIGAPQRTLIDNDAVKVNYVEFKKGFVRPGDVKRKYNTLLVYVDPGRYTITKGAGGPRVENPKPSNLKPGSAVFHRKESIVSESRIDEDYRVLFVMMKN